MKSIIFEKITKDWFCSVCRNAFNSVSTAKLSVSAAAHQIQIAVGCDDSSVTASADDSLAFLVYDNFAWCVCTLFFVVAELAIDSVAPGVHIASRVYVCRVFIPTAEVNDLALRGRSKNFLGLFLLE